MNWKGKAAGLGLLALGALGTAQAQDSSSQLENACRSYQTTTKIENDACIFAKTHLEVNVVNYKVIEVWGQEGKSQDVNKDGDFGDHEFLGILKIPGRGEEGFQDHQLTQAYLIKDGVKAEVPKEFESLNLFMGTAYNVSLFDEAENNVTQFADWRNVTKQEIFQEDLSLNPVRIVTITNPDALYDRMEDTSFAKNLTVLAKKGDCCSFAYNLELYPSQEIQLGNIEGTIVMPPIEIPAPQITITEQGTIEKPVYVQAMPTARSTLGPTLAQRFESGAVNGGEQVYEADLAGISGKVEVRGPSYLDGTFTVARGEGERTPACIPCIEGEASYVDLQTDAIHPLSYSIGPAISSRHTDFSSWNPRLGIVTQETRDFTGIGVGRYQEYSKNTPSGSITFGRFSTSDGNYGVQQTTGWGAQAMAQMALSEGPVRASLKGTGLWGFDFDGSLNNTRAEGNNYVHLGAQADLSVFPLHTNPNPFINGLHLGIQAQSDFEQLKMSSPQERVFIETTDMNVTPYVGLRVNF